MIDTLKPLFFSIARIAIVTYIAFGFFLFFMQRDLLYHPSGAAFGSCPELKHAEALTLPDGARGYFLQKSTERVVVMYHGNAGSACDRALYAQFFNSRGYSAFIAEYAGYGEDVRGTPSVKRILQDAREIAAFIEAREFETVVLVGKSLGASVAAYHTTLHEPDSLVLISPVVSVAKRAQEMYPLYPVSLLLRKQYDTLTWASQAPEVPITLIHESDDTLIPPRHSRELYALLPQREKTLTVIDGAEHNTLIAFPLFWETLDQALRI